MSQPSFVCSLQFADWGAGSSLYIICCLLCNFAKSRFCMLLSFAAFAKLCTFRANPMCVLQKFDEADGHIPRSFLWKLRLRGRHAKRKLRLLHPLGSATHTCTTRTPSERYGLIRRPLDPLKHCEFCKGRGAELVSRTNMPRVEVAGRTFDSQKQLEGLCRNLWKEIDACEDVRKHPCAEFAEFILCLLNRHPNAHNKLHCRPLERIELRKTGAGHGFRLHYVGGGVDDISWRKCVSGKPASQRQRLTAAFRQVVQPQIDEFRAANPVAKCTRCNIEFGNDDPSHIDHAPPWEFRVIVEKFTGTHGEPTGDMVANAPLTMYRHRFHDEHKAYADEFARYHREHACLRVICKTCNLQGCKL